MILFGIVFLLIYVAIVVYIGWGLWGLIKRKEVSRKFKLLYIVTYTTVSISFILGRLFENVLLQIIGAFWMAIFYLLVILIPVLHISVWLLGFTSISRTHIDKWSRLIVFGIFISFISYGIFNAYNSTVVTYEIKVEKEVEEIDQLRIVMASDMHFGMLNGKRQATRLVENINELHPDVVLFPGDFVDDDIEPFKQKKNSRNSFRNSSTLWGICVAR